MRTAWAPLPSFLSILAIIGTSLWCADVHAGLSPENVVVVVNADSHDSRTVANHYVQLRHVPSSNVIMLHDVPEGLTIELGQFKDTILTPLMEQLNARKLAAQTRVIAYSAGFPTSVKIDDHTSRLVDAEQKKYQLPTASLTGLTYFYQFLLADSPKYLEWGSNLYARGPFERNFANPFLDDDRRRKFDEGVKSRNLNEFGAAAQTFEELFQGMPTLAPLAILAAECHALEGDTESASRLIEQSIAAGWTSGTYLDESDLLSPLLETPRLARLRKGLANHPTVAQEPIGFHASVGWMASGFPGSSLQEGVPYLMACMLAVIHPRGSTIEQSVSVLERASTCDATFPQGSFWFTYTRDARTEPRFPQLGNALIWLKKSGFDAEIIHDSLPNAKSGPCVGLMLGVADIPLQDQKWHFVPGALSENLTSLSAQFDSRAQTKITALLHAGAAMSGGSVFEPYNLPFKFPSAMMYGYYASGTSAIEAFYLSVTSPYQLLIVGDPLAQPFARSPLDQIEVESETNESGGQRIRFVRRALPLGESTSDARAIEVYVEGKLVQITPAVNRIEMSLPEQITGAVELRAVLVGSGSIQPRRGQIEWLILGDSTQIPTSEPQADGITIGLQCPGAASIELTHHGEQVALLESSEGLVTIDRERLGGGPLRLRPVANIDGKKIPGKTVVVGN